MNRNLRLGFIQAVTQGDYLQVNNYLTLNIDPNTNDCILIAIENNDIKMLKLLVSKGANISFDKEAALRIAAQLKYHKIIKFLINNGANARIAFENCRTDITQKVLTIYL